MGIGKGGGKDGEGGGGGGEGRGRDFWLLESSMTKVIKSLPAAERMRERTRGSSLHFGFDLIRLADLILQSLAR